MATMSWAFGWLADMMSACMTWFGALLAAIDGSSEAMIGAFMLCMIISALIIPLRGAGMSDRVKSTRNGKTQETTYNRRKQVGN